MFSKKYFLSDNVLFTDLHIVSQFRGTSGNEGFLQDCDMF